MVPRARAAQNKGSRSFHACLVTLFTRDEIFARKPHVRRLKPTIRKRIARWPTSDRDICGLAAGVTENRQRMRLRMFCGRSMSIVSMSLANRLTSRPVGVMSKNDMAQCKMFDRKRLCNLRDARSVNTAVMPNAPIVVAAVQSTVGVVQSTVRRMLQYRTLFGENRNQNPSEIYKGCFSHWVEYEIGRYLMAVRGRTILNLNNDLKTNYRGIINKLW